jgi:membrane protease subunit HflC
MENAKKHSGIVKWVIGAILLVVLAFFGFTAEVREGEYAVITRFGAVRAEVTEAGLYAKLPWPFENVKKYDVRNQYTESAFLETLTKDKRNIILQSFAVWSVEEPLKYHNSVGDNATAENFINALIVNASNSVMGKYDLANVVSCDTAQLRLAEIEQAIFDHVEAHALRDYGIKISDISIMKLSLPEGNLESVFSQMSADRQKYVDQISAAGQRDASKIVYDADAEASEIEAEGTREAAEIDAETERLVAQIYAEAQAANMELFKFILELETVKNSVGEDDVLIIQKGEFLEGLFSEELLQMVKDAQNANNALEPNP